ncbi:10417_t:CDS:2 [Cetraspora pellucida]|uniref:10417_t:CDS:1 n=1 Tax=Cetraspora pellucida TaxID=1433469 RepID=A0A9N9HFE2_9GLOM|nr:10417_t:CDS:2 [Cetraspora pellucida]
MSSMSEILNFVIGFLVSFAASVMNAVGLNLLKLDHVKNLHKPSESQRHECGRPLWHFGLYLYIMSQLVGSTIALNYLKAQWVAPLGSISLIFNFVFARMLVGTRITKADIIGTFVVIISVIWIVVFGGMTGQDVALYCYWILQDDQRKMRDSFLKGIETKRLKKAVGMTMAGVGGLIASQTLLLAKSGVKLFYISVTVSNQFTDNLSYFILVGLLITAVLQVCKNLELMPNLIILSIVPMFYGFYTAMGLVNSMIYLDEIRTYPLWALLLVTIGIATLVYGVCMLSASKESSPVITDEFDFEDDEPKGGDMNGWDTMSVEGGSNTEGSETGMLNNTTDKKRLSIAGKQFGDGRIFSFSSKRFSIGSSSSIFRMSTLRSNNSNTDFRDIKSSHINNIDLDNNSSASQITIENEDKLSDEFTTQTIIPIAYSATKTYEVNDLMLFTPTAPSEHYMNLSSSHNHQTSDNNMPSTLSPSHQRTGHVYPSDAESVVFARSFDDLLYPDALKNKDLNSQT